MWNREKNLRFFSIIAAFITFNGQYLLPGIPVNLFQKNNVKSKCGNLIEAGVTLLRGFYLKLF